MTKNQILYRKLKSEGICTQLKQIKNMRYCTKSTIAKSKT